MSETVPNPRGVLYNIACAASSAALVPNLVMQAQTVGWKVCVITTPQGTRFLNIPLLEQLTGYPVRSEYKRPEEPDVLPRADAIVVFPATFNTINKWALGISDTLAVGILCEYTGLKMPIVLFPAFVLAAVLMVIPPSSEVSRCSETLACVCSTSQKSIPRKIKCLQT